MNILLASQQAVQRYAVAPQEGSSPSACGSNQQAEERAGRGSTENPWSETASGTDGDLLQTNVSPSNSQACIINVHF